MLTLVFAASALVPAIGCGVDVHEAEPGKSVDIKSPLGDVSVRTDVKNLDTGLPVYPGAQPLREHGDHESANVNVASRWFGVKVIAAKYESDDAQDRILEFYRREMKTYGTVTECRGDVDFRGGPGARRVVCKEQPSSRRRAAGDRHRGSPARGRGEAPRQRLRVLARLRQHARVSARVYARDTQTNLIHQSLRRALRPAYHRHAP